MLLRQIFPHTGARLTHYDFSQSQIAAVLGPYHKFSIVPPRRAPGCDRYPALLGRYVLQLPCQTEDYDMFFSRYCNIPFLVLKVCHCMSDIHRLVQSFEHNRAVFLLSCFLFCCSWCVLCLKIGLRFAYSVTVSVCICRIGLHISSRFAYFVSVCVFRRISFVYFVLFRVCRRISFVYFVLFRVLRRVFRRVFRLAYSTLLLQVFQQLCTPQPITQKLLSPTTIIIIITSNFKTPPNCTQLNTNSLHMSSCSPASAVSVGFAYCA